MKYLLVPECPKCGSEDTENTGKKDEETGLLIWICRKCGHKFLDVW